MSVEIEAKRLKHQPKSRLLTVTSLDGRTRARRIVKQLIAQYQRQLGGQFTAEQKLAAERAAVLGALTLDAEARALIADPKAPSLEDCVRLENAWRRAERLIVSKPRRISRPAWAR
jgi:hypothetical protein